VAYASAGNVTWARRITWLKRAVLMPSSSAYSPTILGVEIISVNTLVTASVYIFLRCFHQGE
jgi:hypothetical protein